MDRYGKPERKDHLAMMQDPYKWPYFVLPIKRKNEEGFQEVGLLNGNGPTVYTINLYDKTYGGRMWKDIPHKDYESFEAIVDDGWVVD